MNGVNNVTLWLKQAEYDFIVAESNYKNKHYIYAVFFCHLSIEKALKAMYVKKFKDEPPKFHNLTFFVNKCELQPPPELYDFIFYLSGLSVPTRYPNELPYVSKDYDKAKTKETLKKSKEVLEWVKRNL